MEMINRFIGSVKSVESHFIDRWKLGENTFSRNRKLPPLTLCLQMFASKGQSVKNDLFNFYDNYNENDHVSGWGYTKRRLEINPLMFHDMNKELMTDHYKDPDTKLKTYNGYNILAIDGSDIRIPTTPKNYFEFGHQTRKGVKQANEPCLASISCIYDCLNEYILDTAINPYRTSERATAERHIMAVENMAPEKSVFVFDRGYFSFDLVHLLRNKKFVFRIRESGILKYEQDQLISDDQWVNIMCNSNIDRFRDAESETSKYFKTGDVKLRFVTVTLNTGKKEILVTNLENEVFTKNQISEIYALRWNIETAYRNMKSQMKLEEFSGKLSELIRQDIYICVLLYNYISGIINEKSEIKQEKYKHKMKINRNYSVGIIKTLFVRIVFASKEEREELTALLISEINKNLVPIRPGIKNERKRNVKNKSSMSYKKSY